MSQTQSAQGALQRLTGIASGRLLSLGRRLASSGEGTVWETSLPGFLAKLYHHPTLERQQKLEVMLAHPPKDPMLRANHISFAWPQDLLQDAQGKFVGFLMPTIHNGVKLSSIYSPRLRRRHAPRFNWYYLHTAALNVASVIESIHAKGYVVGDIKPQNLLVNDRALVSVIDTDSFQIRDPLSQKIYRCQVGSEGFTPVELLGKDLASLDQSDVQDRFRLGVLIYLLLFGDHPFKGKWIGPGEAPSPTELIRQGFWPYGQGSLIQAGPTTIPLTVIHPGLQTCFRRCFSDGHTNPEMRPTAAEWFQALKTAIASLKHCRQSPNHYYNLFYGQCYWCERQKNLGLDIFDPAPPRPAAASVTTPPPAKRQPSSQPSPAITWPPVLSRRKPFHRRYKREMVAGSAFFLALLCLLILVAPENTRFWDGLQQNSTNQLPTPSSSGGKVLPPASRSTPKSIPDQGYLPLASVSPSSAIALSPNGKTLVTGSTDLKIRVWNTEAGSLESTFFGHSEQVVALAFNADGKDLFSIGANAETLQWQVNSGQLLSSFDGIDSSANSTGSDSSQVVISPDASLMASSVPGEGIVVRNLLQGSRLFTLSNVSAAEQPLAISQNGKLLLSSSPQAEIQVWNLQTRKLIRRFASGSRGSIAELARLLALSPDGRKLFNATSGDQITIENVYTGKRLRTLSSSGITSLVVSQNGQLLLSGSSKGEINFWKLPSGRLSQIMREPGGEVLALALSDDDRILATRSGDQEVRIWQLTSGQLLHTLPLR